MIRRLILFGIVWLVAACGNGKPTPLFRPTSTAAPPVPPVLAQPTATPAPILAPTQAVTLTPVSSTPAEVAASPTSPSPSSTPAPFPPAVALEPAWTGFENPVFLTFAGDTPEWAARLFVVEKAGRIRLIEGGQVQPASFLDITDRVGASANEQGLLSVAFPPEFDDAFFVYYTDQNGDTVVARFRLLQREPPLADPASEQVLLTIDQPAGNHNGGQLQFGPDGYLYIGTGDGGRAGDPWGNAQNPDQLLGKLLRIDVRGDDAYRIPADNPYVTWAGVRPEIWALGLRNPWRFSFDRATGDLYIADVGQNVYEEIDFQPAFSSGGENYGWDILEGNHCFEPQTGCDDTGLIPPVFEYDHSQGCSVTGGYVYRGERFPQLTGVYFFGDFCSGRVWGLQRTSSGEWRSALLLESNLSISSFGEGADGELYALDYRTGGVYRLVAAP